MRQPGRPPVLYRVLTRSWCEALSAGANHREELVEGARGVSVAMGTKLPYTRLLLRFKNYVALKQDRLDKVTKMHYVITVQPVEVPDAK